MMAGLGRDVDIDYYPQVDIGLSRRFYHDHELTSELLSLQMLESTNSISFRNGSSSFIISSSPESISPRSCSSFQEEFYTPFPEHIEDLGDDSLFGFSPLRYNPDDEPLSPSFPYTFFQDSQDTLEATFEHKSLSGFSKLPTSCFENSSIPIPVLDRSDEDDSLQDPLYLSENGLNPGVLFDESCQKLLVDDDHQAGFTEASLPRCLPSISISSDSAPVEQQRRKPGRPRKGATAAAGENSTSGREETSAPPSRRRRKQHPWKGHHLWEFIRELLENNDDPNRPGSDAGELVRWENREKGVFLIVNSKLVAELWGKRKRNSKMTYEKLSRSLRWCRTSGFLAEVPKDRKYPKKLCFCFGHRAYDIHRSTPTTDSTAIAATS